MKKKAWARLARSVGRNKRTNLPVSNKNESASVSSRPRSAVEKRPSDVVAETIDSSGGYAAYGEFVKDELEAQDKRKASFEQRGLAVITTSGTLVTLLFALAALSTKSAATFTLSTAARTWLTIALALFLLSALAALRSNALFSYQAVVVEDIRERLREKPPRNADAAAKDIAFTRLKALESAKLKNDIKGKALRWGLRFEALAVGCVAVAVALIL
jgi:hypothetical protein